MPLQRHVINSLISSVLIESLTSHVMNGGERPNLTNRCLVFERHLVIRGIPSFESYEFMEDFIDQLPEGREKQDLAQLRLGPFDFGPLQLHLRDQPAPTLG